MCQIRAIQILSQADVALSIDSFLCIFHCYLYIFCIFKRVTYLNMVRVVRRLYYKNFSPFPNNFDTGLQMLLRLPVPTLYLFIYFFVDLVFFIFPVFYQVVAYSNIYISQKKLSP